jgi:hypothetical protein
MIAPLREVKESATPCGSPEGGALWAAGALCCPYRKTSRKIILTINLIILAYASFNKIKC